MKYNNNCSVVSSFTDLSHEIDVDEDELRDIQEAAKPIIVRI